MSIVVRKERNLYNYEDVFKMRERNFNFRRQEEKNYNIRIKQNIEVGMEKLGTKVWGGSVLLCEFIVSNRNNGGLMEYEDYWRKKVVVEIGTGTGLTSILLGKLNCQKIYALDRGVDVLKVLKENIQLNQVESNVQVMEHSWGEEIEIPDPIDIIFAGDVVYTNSDLKGLLWSLKQLTSLPNTPIIFMTYKPRIAVREILFFKKALQYFQIDEVDISKFSMELRSGTEGRIYRLKRRKQIDDNEEIQLKKKLPESLNKIYETFHNQ